ncbi:hypothetical protein AAFC00_000568 [Neodothiora populina]
MPRKLWEHPSPQNTYMARFMQDVNRRRGLSLKTYEDLYEWSVSGTDFWADLFDLHPLVHHGKYTRPVDPTARMDSSPQWFSGVKLNFAENILFSTGSEDNSERSVVGKEDDKTACTEVREGCHEIQNATWRELRERVGLMAQAMKAHGVEKGDRVAVVASNSIDTLTVMLAIASVGGLFSSSSTDMGIKGILDRLLQIKPRFVFVDDWAVYNGKKVDLRGKMEEIVGGMQHVREFKGLVSMPRFHMDPLDVGKVARSLSLASFLKKSQSRKDLVFERLDFCDQFLIVYSSGTTGVPKCIVHSIGGVLLNGQKEGKLHRDLGPTTVGLQYTTTGWIMYLQSVMALQHGARSILYDGSPFQPDLRTFVKLVGEQKVTDLGISPRYLQTLASASPPVIPKAETDLSHLRRITSTGMVLSESLFEWVYDVAFPPTVQLANISGGTDLAGCFGLETPLKPVYVGGCQARGLGLKVEIFDQTLEGGKGVRGKPMATGEAGELVVTAPFPNQPVMFWGDKTGEKLFDAYFGRFDNTWTHGDFIHVHPKTGGVYFLGRSDGVLNPSGVRFGSAEIYSAIETFFDKEVQDSLCVGRRRPADADESVMLFLLMKPGQTFNQDLVKKVRQRIGKECSQRHIPKYIFETPEIPTTVNLKKVELPVKRIVSGEIVKPSGTLLNPESLEYYYQFAKVEDTVTRRSKL